MPFVSRGEFVQFVNTPMGLFIFFFDLDCLLRGYAFVFVIHESVIRKLWDLKMNLLFFISLVREREKEREREREREKERDR